VRRSARRATPVPPSGAASRDALQSKLAKLGLLRDEDLVLHLPLRCEDETRITSIDGNSCLGRDSEHVSAALGPKSPTDCGCQAETYTPRCHWISCPSTP
jgi:hypothetical protein